MTLFDLPDGKSTQDPGFGSGIQFLREALHPWDNDQARENNPTCGTHHPAPASLDPLKTAREVDSIMAKNVPGKYMPD